MSATVDNRIVEMQFNNQQFERNAHESISTLEKLKKALNFDKSSSKALDDLNKKSKAVNLDSLAKSVDALSNRFSTMGIIGITALQRITNAAITTGKKVVEALTIDPIKTGLQEYETKIGAIQVIRANDTEASMQDIASSLDELNHYADKTIYNFAQMTSNVGKFVAQGLGVQEAANAVKGMANLAAASGASPQDMARATYQMSQALGGVIRKIDVNSLRNANMWTMTLKDTLIDIARAEGIAIDEMIEQKGTLEDTLEEGWLTGQMFTKAMNIYSGVYEDVQLKAMGFNDEQIAKFKEIAKTAEEAAVEVKTFTQLIDTIKESVQSGWTQTWETIIGDFEESKRLWTSASQLFEAMFGGIAERRNAFLDTWKNLGGRDQLIRAIVQSFRNLLAILEPIKKAFSDTFQAMQPERLAYLTMQFKEFMRSIAPSQATINNIYIAFKGLFSVAKGAIGIFRAVGSAIIQIVSPFASVIGQIGEMISFAGFLATELVDLAEKTGFFQQVTYGLITAFYRFVGIAKNVAAAVAYLVSEFFKLPAVRQAVGSLLIAVANFGMIVATYIQKAAFYIGEFINKLQNLKQEDLAPYLETVNQLLIFFGNTLGTVKNVVVGFFGAIVLGVSKLLNFGDIIKGLGDRFKNLGDALRNLNQSGDGFKIFDSLKEKLEVFKGGFTGFLDAVVAAVKKLDISKAIILGFGAAVIYTIVSVSRAIGAIPRLLGTTNKVLKDLDKVIRHYRGEDQIGDTIIKIAAAIGILAGSLFLISKIKSEDFVPAMVGMGAMMTMMAGLIAVSAVLAAKHLSARFAANATALLSIAGSVAILAVGLRVLSGLRWEDMKDGITAIGDLMVLMFVVSAAMSKFTGSFMKGAISTVILAVSISKLVETMTKLSTIPVDELKQGMDSLAEIMLMLTVLTGIAGKMSFGSAAGVLAIVLSIGLIQNALKSIAENGIGLDEIIANIGKYVVIIGALVGLMKLTQLAGANAMGGGVAILAMSVSIHLLIGAIAELGLVAKLVGPGMLVGVIALLGLVGVIKTMLMALADTKDVSVRASLALIPLTLCLSLLGVMAGMIGLLPASALAKGFVFMAGIGMIISTMVEATESAYGVNFKPILAMVAGIGVIIAGLAVLSLTDPGSLLISAISLGLVLGVFGSTLQAASEMSARVKVGPILALTATLGVMIAGLGILANPDLSWANMIVGAVSLGIVMLALGKATDFIGDAGLKSAGVMLGLSASIAVLAGSLYLLGQLNLQQLGVAVLGIVVALGALVAVAALFGNIPQLAAGLVALGGGLMSIGAAAVQFGIAAAAIGAGVYLVANALTMLGQVSQTECENIYNTIITFFTAIGVGVASMIVSFFATIGEAIGNGIRSLIDKITGSTGEFQNAGFSVMDAIKIGIFAAMPLPLQAAALAIGGIVDFIRGKRSEMEGAGNDMMLGIADGADAAAGQARASGEGVADELEGGFRDQLGWHSPIEKFFKVLVDLGNSIAQGAPEGAAIAGEAGGQVGDATGEGCFNGMESWMPAIRAKYGEMCAMRDEMAAFASGGWSDKALNEFEKNALRDANSPGRQMYNERKRLDDIEREAREKKEREDKIAADLEKAGYKSKSGKGGGGGSGKGKGGGGGGGGGTKAATKEMKKLFNVVKDGDKVIQKFAENVGDAYKTAGYTHPLQMGQAAVQKLAEKIYAASVKTVDAETQMAKTSEEKLAEMREAFIKFHDNLKTTISGQADIWGGLTQKTAITTKDWVKNLKTQRMWVGQWEKDLRYAAERINDENVMSWIIEQGPEFDMQLKKLLSSSDKEFEEWEKEVGSLDNLYEDAVNSAMAAYAEYYTKLETSTVSTEQVVANAWDQIGVVVWKAGEAQATVVKEFVAGNEEMTKSTEEMAKATKQAIEGAMYDYLSLRDAVTGSVNDQMDLFSKFDTDTELTGDDLHDNMKSQIDGLRDWSAGMTQLLERGLDRGLYQKLAEMGPKSYEYVQAFLEMTTEQLNDANAYFQQSLTIGQEIGEQLGSDFAVAGLMASEGFKQGIDPNAGTAEVKQMALNVVNAFRAELDIHSPSGVTREIGINIDEGLANGITASQTAPVGEAIKMANEIIVRLKGSLEQSQFDAIGRQIAQGLANGITNNQSLAIEAAAGMARAALNAAQDELDINSPSRAFARLGRYSDLGLARGFTEYSDEVDSAATGVANNALNSMRAVVGHIADIINGDLQVDPTIKPVVDLSDVEAGASAVGSIFGGRSYGLSRNIKVQNESSSIGDLISQMMAKQTSNSAPITTPININVYGAQGQSEEELANIIEQRLMLRVRRAGAVWT